MLKSVSGSKISKISSIAVAMATASVQRQLIGLLVDEAQRLLVAHLHEEPEPDQHQNPGWIVPEERRRASQNRNRSLDHKRLALSGSHGHRKGRGLHSGLNEEAAAQIHVCLQPLRPRLLQEHTVTSETPTTATQYETNLKIKYGRNSNQNERCPRCKCELNL